LVIFPSPLDSNCLEPDSQVSKGSIGLAFTSRILTENLIINQAFGLLLLRVISVHAEPNFRTPVLPYNRCAAPAKRPVCGCLHRYECQRRGETTSEREPRGTPFLRYISCPPLFFESPCTKQSRTTQSDGGNEGKAPRLPHTFGKSWFRLPRGTAAQRGGKRATGNSPDPSPQGSCERLVSTGCGKTPPSRGLARHTRVKRSWAALQTSSPTHFSE
jgi:hypothetical protein